MSEVERIGLALAERDPETLLGPTLLMLTWLARRPDAGLRCRLQAHLMALALHPGMSLDVRRCAGALAMGERASALH